MDLMTVYSPVYAAMEGANEQVRITRAIIAASRSDIDREIVARAAGPIAAHLAKCGLEFSVENVLARLPAQLADIAESETQRGCRIETAGHLRERLIDLGVKVHPDWLADFCALLVIEFERSGLAVTDDAILAAVERHRSRSPKLFAVPTL